MMISLLAVSELAAQTGSVAGRVTDSQSGQTIPAAQVFIADLDIGGLTQQNGAFLLLNVPVGTQTVTVQRLGYRDLTQQVTVASGETAVVDFEITEEALQLDAIVVTGTPGGTQKRAIGNAVTQVEVGDITERVAITNVQDLLSGRSTGLNFSRLSGNVGTGSPIRIRGVGSFSLNSNPLIYVDGVRVNNNSRAGPTLGTGFSITGDNEGGTGDVNVLDDFNPEDIESIEVIKGPAAATLYGTEASAGVIQIITKKGNEGDAQFNVSVRQGTNFMTDPAGRLGDMFTCRNSFTPPCTGSELEGYNMYDEANNYIRSGYFDWPTENLYQYGHTQGYNVDVRGGTQNVRYFLSGNYEDEEGIEWFNTDETFRLRGNVSVVFSENWTLDVSTGYVDGATRFGAPTISDGGTWQDLVWSNGFCLQRLNPDACPRLGGFQEHLPADVADIEATRDYSRFTGSATLNHTVGDWFTQRAVIGVDKGWDINQVIFPLESANPPAVYSETVEGQINYARPVNTNLSMDYAATATFDYNQFRFATSAGAQYYTEELEDLSTIGRGFASPLSRTVNQTAIEKLTLGYNFVENKSLGFYVQEEVGINDRIFVTGAVRFDDNSAFGADFDAQIYPKISGTWVVSEESFWGFDAVNSLRLRGAFGKAGRQPNAFAGQNLYSVIPGPGGLAAITPASPGNTEVGPEVSTELELGFDWALFDDKLSGEFTYFNQKNKDALLGVAIAPSFGFPGSVDQNLGQIDSWGWETSLNARLYDGESMGIDLDLSADHTANEIKDLGTFGGTRAIAIGFPWPNNTTDDLVVSATYDPTGAITDANGNTILAMCDSGVPTGPTPAHGNLQGGAPGVCTEIGEQNILIGAATPTYTFSIAPTLSLMNADLQIFALAEGQYGRWGQENAMEWGHIYNNSRVSREETDPVWVAGDRLSDDTKRELYDADFWKLREIDLRYRLPESLVARTGASRASLALTGRNLFILWRKQEFVYGAHVSDPEYGTPTITGDSNFWVTPPFSSFSATLRVTF